MKFDAVIFDLDGTLWDSSETVARCWQECIDHHGGADVKSDGALIRSLMGLTSEQICERVFAPFGEAGKALCEECLEAEPAYICRHGARLFEGLEEMLSQLKKHFPLFIVSNCQKDYIESFLFCSGYGEYFAGHTCEGDTGLPKAENIRLIMEKHGIKHAVYVGDTASDEKSACAAGCTFVHAAYGFGTAAAPAATVNGISELPSVILALAGEGE